MSQDGRLYVLAAAIAAAVLYGATYQQFRFFDLTNPGGATDATDYVAMARGHVDADAQHRQYRWVIPSGAAALQPLTIRIAGDEDLALRLGFYIVNFAFSFVACLVLFALLRSMQFSALACIIGMVAFATSRVTVLVTGTPMVDAAYFCAIVTLLYLTIAAPAGLVRMMPLLVLSKETIVPFMLLPLLTRLRRSPAFWISLAISAAVFAISSYLSARAYNAAAPTVAATVISHLPELELHAERLFTLAGVHDLLNGFSLWLPVALFGVWLNGRHHYREVPLVIIATIPIAIGWALLSGNLGRMFFACFPAVIVYSLIAIEHVTELRRQP